MVSEQRPKVALVWAQFAPYHVDRCEAVGQRLGARAQVLAVELASASQTYAWDASGALADAQKCTLFPGEKGEDIGRWRRLKALWGALRGSRQVFVGLPYSWPEVIVLSWMLRLTGTKVIMMTDSKFDDATRDVLFEAFKALVLMPYHAAIAAGRRQVQYLRFLRLRQRPILLGYDMVSIARLRTEAAASRQGPATAWAERDFLFVGRFIPKKRLLPMIEAYADYAARSRAAGVAPRRLVLVGSGPDEAQARARVAELGLEAGVVFHGFLQGAQIAAAMDRALALVLVSVEEQWGLVINEALALGLPIILSNQAGASDVLLANLRNGFGVEPGDHAGLVTAMERMAQSEAAWNAMVREAENLAPMGDVERFADAVEMLVLPGAEPATSRHQAYFAAVMGA
jgi:glycosyltransferase involved in cell wall biosynthesis